MGKMTDYGDFYGRCDPVAWDTALRDFISLAADMRSRLGDQGYLLDAHLQMLMSAAATIPLSHVSEEGFRSGSGLREAIRRIMREDVGEETDIYRRVKAYIGEHPLPWQESYTRHSLYFAVLAGTYAGTVVIDYQQKIEAHMQTHAKVDTVKLERRRREICGLLEDKEDMEQLESLFRQCFLPVVPMMGFLQGMADELLTVLISRDEETSKQIFQLLLDAHLACEE